MSSDPNETSPASAPPAEPNAARRAVPVWLLVLLFALLYWGMIYFDQRSGWANSQVYVPYHSYQEVLNYQPRTEGIDLRHGHDVFENYCALCHNSDGMGKKGQAPPLVGSDFVLGSATRVIRIPQIGLSGPIPLRGGIWSEAPSMPPMGAPLSDEDLAAVLTYIRQSWGNKATEVTPEQVKAVRKEVAGRSQPWTAEELNSIQ